MPTPRSESIYKALHGNTDIRPPVAFGDTENKIDHYSILAQVIDRGVETYLDNPDSAKRLENASSLDELATALRCDVGDAVLGTLASDSFIAHAHSLHDSQQQRYRVDGNRWHDVQLNILAGTTTFVTSFSTIFNLLRTTSDTATAVNPDNWRIADRIAKLDIHQFSAYFNVYLALDANWPLTLKQFERTESGAMRFKAGFPGNAVIPLEVVQSAGLLSKDDLLVGAKQDLVHLNDIHSPDAIGCPVTFSPDTIKKLWRVYANTAQRIISSQGSTIDDSEAFLQ